MKPLSDIEGQHVSVTPLDHNRKQSNGWSILQNSVFRSGLSSVKSKGSSSVKSKSLGDSL
jgi:hypothetical protein